MINKEIENNLNSLGLKINNQSVFYNFVQTYKGGFTSFFEMLSLYNNGTLKQFDFDSYENKILLFIRELNTILKSDNMLKSNKNFLIEQYDIVTRNIINSNLVGLKIEQAKKNNIKINEEIQSIERQIEKLDSVNDNDTNRKVQIIDLSLKKAELEEKLAAFSKVVNNEKLIREKATKRDYKKLIIGLKSDIDDLKSILDNMVLSDNTTIKINSLFDKFLEDVESLNSNIDVNDYEDLLKKASLSKNVDHDLQESTMVKSDITSSLDVDSSKDIPSVDFIVGSILVYNGSKSYDNKDNTGVLVKGSSYIVEDISKNLNGNDLIKLKGINDLFSPEIFDLEAIWKDKIESLSNYRVDGFEDNMVVNRGDAYFNAVSSIISSNRVENSVKNFGIRTITSLGFEKLQKYRQLLSSKIKLKNNSFIDFSNYNPEEPLIKEDDFSREFDNIVNHSK